MEHGADFVWESLSKIMNGHSDVILGALCASRDHASALESKFATWGVNAGPFECWLCERGLGTLHVRLTTACENALRIARWLATHARIKSVSYPGLTSHPEHGLCRSQFVDGCGRFGFMLMFEVDGGWEGATRLIERASSIPFCPSLGELTTTFSHPASTSHRRMSPNDLAMAGISAGSIRLSVGIDDPATVIEGIEKGLD
jgi:cystathionine beta-lyase/cystathionine gamma-synthase